VAPSCNHCCRGTAISITHSECVLLTLVCSMQCACAVLSSAACPAVHYFSHYRTNGKIFEKKLLNTQCVFCFSLRLLPETFLILRTERDKIINVYWSSCKLLATLVRFYSNLISRVRFSKNPQ
jgi:hypothetical protein